MVSYSLHKRRTILIVAVAITIGLIIAFVGFPFFGRILYISGLGPKGPYKYPNSTWESKDPCISLHVSDKGSAVEDAEAYVIVDGEKIFVNLYIQADRANVIIQKRDDSSLEGRLLVGELTKCSSEKVEFRVEEDHLFSGRYSSIILWRTGN